MDPINPCSPAIPFLLGAVNNPGATVAGINRTRIIEALIIAGIAGALAGVVSVRLNSAAVTETRATLSKIETRVERTGDEVEDLAIAVAVSRAQMIGMAEEAADAKSERRGTNDWFRSLRDRQLDHERAGHTQ